MPRKNPFPKREREICNRLREFRGRTKLSRVAFAAKAGIDVHLLRSYEIGRSQLNYHAAHKIIIAFAISPEWLATGSGLMFKPVVIPAPSEVNAGPRALFSFIYEAALVNPKDHVGGPTNTWKVPEKSARAFVLNHLLNEAYHWMSYVPLDRLPDFHRVVVAAAEREIESYGYQTAASIEQNAEEVDAFGNLHLPTLHAEIAELRAKLKLTESATSESITSMQGKWPALKKQLQEATEKTGKSALAKFLKVDLTRISQWLTDAASQREPGAEYALQMQEWLKRQT